MTIALTVSPVPIFTNWSTPQTLGIDAIPRAMLTFQRVGTTIAQATTEIITILVSCGLPIGYAYRLADARIMIAADALASSAIWPKDAEGQLIAYSRNNPATSLTKSFRLDAGAPLRGVDGALAGGYASPSDVSSLEYKTIYQSENLPRDVLLAETATTTATFRIASLSATTTVNQELNFSFTFLQYTIQEEMNWALRTPKLVV